MNRKGNWGTKNKKKRKKGRQEGRKEGKQGENLFQREIVMKNPRYIQNL